MNDHHIYHDYSGCPLCEQPNQEAVGNYRISCPKCGEIYILEKAFNDVLYYDISQYDDLPKNLREYQHHAMESKRNEAIRHIRDNPSSPEAPITFSDLDNI